MNPVRDISNSNDLKIDQVVDCAVNSLDNPLFGIRYGFYRSRDSLNASSAGQDYIAIKADDNCVIFALCDGVSQSFMGNIGSKFLGDALITWLDENLPSIDDEKNSQTELKKYLNSIVGEATNTINTYEIDTSIPELALLLESDRKNGSESTFICGKISFNDTNDDAGEMVLFWMGDSEAKLWNNKVNDFPTDSFITDERWSTRLGVVGELPNIYVSSLKENKKYKFDRLIVYSDGISELSNYSFPLPNLTLQNLIKDNFQSPTSDDISFIEINFDIDSLENIKGKIPLDPPANLQIEKSINKINAKWDVIENTDYYEIEISSGQSKNIWKRKDCKWESPELNFYDFDIRIRACDEFGPGYWSDIQIVYLEETDSIETQDTLKDQSPKIKSRSLLFVISIISIIVIGFGVFGNIFSARNIPLGEANNEKAPALIEDSNLIFPGATIENPDIFLEGNISDNQVFIVGGECSRIVLFDFIARDTIYSNNKQIFKRWKKIISTHSNNNCDSSSPDLLGKFFLTK